MLLKQLYFLLQSLFTPSKGLNVHERKLVSIIHHAKSLKGDLEIEKRLNSLKNNQQLITVNDLGAGSKKSEQNRTIADIAKAASIQAKYGCLYQELIMEYGFETAIELGTNFGIGTSYLSKKAKQVLTIEGCPNIAHIAAETFKLLALNNINIQIGSFDDNLNITIPYLKEPCLVYIDGNHTYEATMKYFQFFNKKAKKGSILIFDDIYWSRGMYQFWNEIEKLEIISINLRRVGIVQLMPASNCPSIKKIF